MHHTVGVYGVWEAKFHAFIICAADVYELLFNNELTHGLMNT
jgi:hypothetical protein